MRHYRPPVPTHERVFRPSIGSMTPEEYAACSATEIARRVRAREVSATEVCRAALDRLAQQNPAVNAVTVVTDSDALSGAAALDEGPAPTGLLAGVPVVLKEEYDQAGQVTTLGGEGNSTPRAADGEVVRRLRAAGALIIARTTMPEFGQFPFTESQRYGVTRNPWDPTRSPSGSSGGSAVAVAAGIAPIGLGADGGGSIRLPASACGLVGLKPSRGRVTLAPLAQHWYALVVAGGMTRSVADSALLLDVIAGTTSVDRWRCPEEERTFREQAAADPGVLRIAWTTKPVMPGLTTDPQIATATEGVARTLTRIGHRVRRTEPRWPVPTDAFLPQFYAGMREEVGQVEHPERLEPRTRQTVALSSWATRRLAELAVRRGERVAELFDTRLLTDTDVLVLPTCPRLMPATGHLDGMDSVRAQLATLPYVANMVITNVTGHPAISVPAGLSEEGWPIGVQLVARRGREGLLLAVAAQLEQEQPWPLLALA